MREVCGTLILLTLWAVLPSQAQDTIQLVSRDDQNANHALQMIKLGLEKADYDYELSIREGALTAARQLQDTREGTMDIMWSATKPELEEALLPVRVPLYKGLLGYRVFIMHPDYRDHFAGVTDWETMKKSVYGQGRGWPDTKILRSNGLTVETGTYEGLFMMADGKRFHAFPRGVHEPWSEIESRPELDLIVDEHVMLVYRMPFYLFVTPKKPELAEALEQGLLKAIEDGSFDDLFLNSPRVELVREKADLAERQVFPITNPNLPEATPLDDERLWLDPENL